MTPKTVKSKSNIIGRDTTDQNQDLSIGRRQGPGTFTGQCRDIFTGRLRRRQDISTGRRIIVPAPDRFIADNRSKIDDLRKTGQAKKLVLFFYNFFPCIYFL